MPRARRRKAHGVPEVRGAPGVRRPLIRRFPYAVVGLVHGDIIAVLAVASGELHRGIARIQNACALAATQSSPVAPRERGVNALTTSSFRRQTLPSS
jgi:hypothetical protein